MVVWEILKTSGTGIVDRLNSFLGVWLEGSYWLYVEEGVREKLSKMDLKLLAWATKWMVISLTEVGNRGVRGCSHLRENEFDFGMSDLRCLGNPGANV